MKCVCILLNDNDTESYGYDVDQLCGKHLYLRFIEILNIVIFYYCAVIKMSMYVLV